MGIAKYYDWLKKQYPGVYSSLEKNRYYDHVMFDMNFILHHAIHKARNERHFIIKVYKTLDYLLTRCLPIQSVYLAVDGPPPYSKIALQRQRRSGPDRQSAGKQKLSSLSLTPGTRLMNKMEDYLKKYFEERKHWYSFRKLKITISSSNQAGEGEVKLFEEIHSIAEKHPHDRFLVVGNDADLVVLAMAAIPAYQVDVLIQTHNRYEFISLAELLIAHQNQIEPKIPIKKAHLAKSRNFRNDFAVISMMMGNDYFSRLYYTKIGPLWDAYLTVRRKRSDELIEGDTYNRDFLLAFMRELSKSVHRMYQKVIPKLYEKTRPKEYLEGLLWCLRMYRRGKCPKVDFLYEAKIPSPVEIAHYLETNPDAVFVVPESDVEAVDHEIYSLLVMPRKSRHLLTDRCSEMMDEYFDDFYEIEECPDCIDLRGELSRVNKLLYKLRNDGEETEGVRKEIGQVSKLYAEHKKKHQSIGIAEMVARVRAAA